MGYNVIVRDDAFTDALEAYLYYEEKQKLSSNGRSLFVSRECC